MYPLLVAGLLALAISGAAHAQIETYPSKPVKVISDSAPGSNIDVTLRLFVDRMSKAWGQQVVVINHPGAGGAIAARVASEAAPDGYTLFMPALSLFLAVPGKAANLPLQLPRDFLPVGFFSENPMFIAAAPSLGVSTLAELIALARNRPREISYAVTGVGRLTHLTGELLQSRTEIELLMVPYTGGSAQALSDVVGGRVPVIIEGYAGALGGAIQSGSLRALALAAAQRLPEFPDIPAVAETIPGFTATGWQVLVAPPGTPETFVNKASETLLAVVRDPELRQTLAKRGAYTRPLSPAQTMAFVQAEQQMWKPAIERIAVSAR
jgi:tripartite-type tricarboxylate transporter receptor subunit TctC